jgi:1A family penicillin-binding protein
MPNAAHECSVWHRLAHLLHYTVQMPLKLRQHVVQLARDWTDARRRYPRTIPAVVGVFALAVVFTIAGGVWFAASLLTGMPERDAIRRIGDMDQATAVYDAADQFAFTIYKEQRIEVALSAISPHLIHAILDIEDQRFYQHQGIDTIRIVSAAVANVRHLRVAQGGSTITQQLARQSFLRPDKTLRRKLQEAILASRIERLYEKPQILEMYLNKVYFGDGLYGAEAASRGYFAKHASELTVPEAALLAGLVKSPSSYAPTVSMERAVLRRNIVLQTMLEAGHIDRSIWQSARTEKVALHDGLRAQEPHGQYFKEQVRRELVDRFGWQRVYQGGLRVFSTIDMKMQRAAESAITDSLKALDGKRDALAARRARAAGAKTVPAQQAAQNPADALQAALVALDPHTGHVRAMIGGRSFDASSFNRATQARRQPGSAFKPFVYATALEAGYTPATLIDGLNTPVATLQGAWTPDDEHSDSDSMTMRTALRTSSNRAAVRMLQEVGIARTVQGAKQMGVGDVPGVPSLALGSGEVTLQAMTAAYAAFANEGLVPQPILIRRVEDQDGRVLFEQSDSATRAISEQTAFLMTTMLADVVNAGTAAGARRLGFTLPAAGKTGTTNNFNDAWFIGFTPNLVAGVWVGFDQPHTILPNGFAADIAVPAWATFMKAATRGDKPEWFAPPVGITTANVCRLSGQLAGEGCQDVEVVARDGSLERRSTIYTEYFVRGTEPTTFCDMHPTHGLMTKVAGMFGVQPEKPSPPPVEDVVPAPAPPAATTGSQPDAQATPQDAPKEKKRGFWSKLLGIGKGGNKDDRKREDEKPQKKKGGL